MGDVFLKLARSFVKPWDTDFAMQLKLLNQQGLFKTLYLVRRNGKNTNPTATWRIVKMTNVS